MTDRAIPDPKYRHYRPKNLGVVRIDGRDHYLGAYSSPESLAKYHRLLAEWRASNIAPVAPSAPAVAQPTVALVLLAYLRYASKHHRTAEGRPTLEYENVRAALRPVRLLYGDRPAPDFGPKALRAVQQQLVRDGLARTTINARINRIRRCFRWAASVEMIGGDQVHALGSVPGLLAGRSDAREAVKVEAVSVANVEATLVHLSGPVAAMVRLQLLTAMRCGEVMNMTVGEIHEGPAGWEYRPAAHKTAWRGHERIIPLGPKAMAIVREYLTDDPDTPLFRPAVASAGHRERRAAARRTKRTPSELARQAKRPGRTFADRYDRGSYRQAVLRACDRAFPHPTLSAVPSSDLTDDQRRELKAWRKSHRWSPLRLRHAAATAIRQQYGLEAAQVVLGHARADVTQVYAAKNAAKAREIMNEIG